MKTLYLDCFAGIAGDMFIGALLNLMQKLPFGDTAKNILIDGIKKITALNPDEYELIIEDTAKNSIAGINFDVKLNHEHHHHHDHEHEHAHEHHHRHLADIEAMISSSGLSLRVKREILRAFSILAEAEAHVHDEVGAVDSIIDISGAFILMEALGWPRVLCSPVNTGSGTVECAHGILPVPAPATEYLLHGIPVFSNGSPMERTTPTGALIAKILADGFSSIPNGKILASGFGFGNRQSPDMPNALRVLFMETSSETEIDGLIRERISLIETNIDDMNPQDYENVIEKLFASSALDVWTENINMKKSRPGVKLCCLARPEDVMKLSEIILKNTTSQGVRFSDFDRLRLKWHIEERDTPLGKIHFKITELNGETLREIPEYEDLKKLADENKISLFEARKKIYLQD